MAARTLPPRDILCKLMQYDPETGVLLWRARTSDMFPSGKKSAEHQCNVWNSAWAGTRALNTVDDRGGRYGSFFYKKVKAHRAIWKMVTGEDACEIDHIDGDPSNNRIANLRSVSHDENMKNVKRPVTNTSGYIGVTFSAAARKWLAQIDIEGEHIYLGIFEDINDAVVCRKRAEAQYDFHQNHGR